MVPTRIGPSVMLAVSQLVTVLTIRVKVRLSMSAKISETIKIFGLILSAQTKTERFAALRFDIEPLAERRE
jgi:hypothetical protein